MISYDIPDNRRRTRLAKVLLDFGERVQYSVFEADLDKKLFDRLLQRVNNEINDQEDSVRIYPLCSTYETGITIFGQGQVIEDKDVYIL